MAKRATASNSSWLASVAPSIPLAVGMILLGSDVRSSGGLSDTGILFLFVLGIWAVVFAASGLWAIGAARRRRFLLLRRPDGLAISSLRSRALDRDFEILVSRAEVQTRPLPHSLTLFATVDGAEVWGGYFHFRRYCFFPWGQVVEVSSAVVDQPSRRAVILAIAVPDGAVDLPFVTLGGGPFGAFSMPWRRFERVVEDLESVRLGNTLRSCPKADVQDA